MTASWNPPDYVQHSSVQAAWGEELIELLALTPSDDVLDIGCGDGRLTAQLAARASEGRVLGVDASEEMVRHARACLPAESYPNLRFELADAAALAYDREFTAVFSSAALHWVSEHEGVVNGIARALRPGGRCVLQMGGRGNVAAVIDVYRQCANADRWRPYFNELPTPWTFLGTEEYQVWLTAAGLEPQVVELIDKDAVHPDVEAFLGWLRTTSHSFSGLVPAAERDAYLCDVRDAYLDQHPPDKAGRVHVAMVRLQVEAHKP